MKQQPVDAPVAQLSVNVFRRAPGKDAVQQQIEMMRVARLLQAAMISPENRCAYRGSRGNCRSPTMLVRPCRSDARRHWAIVHALSRFESLDREFSLKPGGRSAA
jgi:hypothetical protein